MVDAVRRGARVERSAFVFLVVVRYFAKLAGQFADERAGLPGPGSAYRIERAGRRNESGYGEDGDYGDCGTRGEGWSGDIVEVQPECGQSRGRGLRGGSDESEMDPVSEFYGIAGGSVA